MCLHAEIILSPTPENSWGIADTCDVRCAQCGIPLLSRAGQKEICDLIARSACRIVSGEKYLAP